MDASVFKQMFMPHSRRMYATAWRLTADAQAAEDLVQEAFLKLWMKRDSLNKVENTEAFCTTIVRNIFFDRYRKNGNRFVEQPPEKLNIADDSNISEQLEHRENAIKVMNIIARLPEQQRLIITLRDIEDLSYSEIAAQTGLQAINIRVLLSRARKQIREQFNKQTEYERRRD